jgi:hypothetical protein
MALEGDMEAKRSAEAQKTRRGWFALGTGALAALLISACGKKNDNDDED